MSKTTGHQPETGPMPQTPTTGSGVDTSIDVEAAEARLQANLDPARAMRLEAADARRALVPISQGGGVDYANVMQMVDAAKLLATAGPMLPPWLQNNVGGMFSICMRAQELGMSPLTLANWTYVVENKGVSRVSYESQFFHAVIEARAPIKKRIEWEIIGADDERRCRVWATLKGETDPRVFLSDTLAKLRPGKNQYGQTKGSPLWDTKPDLQMFYNASRDFARVYFPDILGGVYGKDEMQEAEIAHQGAANARDVSPPVGLRERLRGPTGEGFEHTKSSIDASIAAASTVDHMKDKTVVKSDVEPEAAA